MVSVFLSFYVIFINKILHDKINMAFLQKALNNYCYDLEVEINSSHSSDSETALNYTYKEKFYEDTEETLIPICIFGYGYSGLRALVKYLVEIKKLNYADIAKLLQRDQRTIWTSYQAIRKKPEYSAKELSEEKIFLSTKLFRQRKTSVLETISIFLKDKGYSLTQSAKILGKSPKTIWTSLNRSEFTRNKSLSSLKTNFSSDISTKNHEKSAKKLFGELSGLKKNKDEKEGKETSETKDLSKSRKIRELKHG